MNQKKIEFESVLEELMYPEIKKIAEAFELNFTYQEAFCLTEDCDWIAEKMEDGADYNDLLDWADQNEVSTTYTYEKYRVDFTLIGHGIKIAIELDSKEWHTDEEADKVKDDFLKERGFIVWRFFSNELFGIKNRQRTIKRIVKDIENFESVKIWKESIEKKRMLRYWISKFLTPHKVEKHASKSFA